MPAGHAGGCPGRAAGPHARRSRNKRGSRGGEPQRAVAVNIMPMFSKHQSQTGYWWSHISVDLLFCTITWRPTKEQHRMVDTSKLTPKAHKSLLRWRPKTHIPLMLKRNRSRELPGNHEPVAKNHQATSAATHQQVSDLIKGGSRPECRDHSTSFRKVGGEDERATR